MKNLLKLIIIGIICIPNVAVSANISLSKETIYAELKAANEDRVELIHRLKKQKVELEEEKEKNFYASVHNECFKAMIKKESDYDASFDEGLKKREKILEKEYKHKLKEEKGLIELRMRLKVKEQSDQKELQKQELTEEKKNNTFLKKRNDYLEDCNRFLLNQCDPCERVHKNHIFDSALRTEKESLQKKYLNKFIKLETEKEKKQREELTLRRRNIAVVGLASGLYAYFRK